MFQAGGFSAGSREGLYIVLCETVITLSLSHPWYATVQFRPSYIQIFLQNFRLKAHFIDQFLASNYFYRYLYEEIDRVLGFLDA